MVVSWSADLAARSCSLARSCVRTRPSNSPTRNGLLTQSSAPSGSPSSALPAGHGVVTTTRTSLHRSSARRSDRTPVSRCATLPSRTMRSGASSSISLNSSARSVAVETENPCSRRSHEIVPATTGSRSATTTREPFGVPFERVSPEELTQSFPLDVAAAQNGDRRTAAARLNLALEQRGHGDRATRFDDQLQAIDQQSHRAAQRRVVHRDDVVEETLMMRVGQRAYLNGKQ